MRRQSIGREQGADWSWTTLSTDRFDDRPWIEALPDGTLHVIWNDGAGVSYAVSNDNGRTWQERPRIHTKGGSSHLAVGPRGEVAVRITPVSASRNRMDEDTDLIAISSDGGSSWQLREAPGTREWTFPFNRNVGVPRWVEPIAWDAAGALYYLWSEGSTLRLGRSVDQGTTWSISQVAEDQDVMYYPYLSANQSGELAATWYSGRGADLTAHVAHILVDQTGSVMRVARATPLQFEIFSEGEDGELVRGTAGEYFPVIFLRDGSLAVVSPIRDPSGDRRGFTWRPIRLPQ